MNNFGYEKTAYNYLLRNYPQYEQLREQCLKFIYRKVLVQGQPIDCYVDLNSYLHSLYKVSDQYPIDVKYSVAGSIINFAAHIVEFFHSRFGIHARIFLVFASSRPTSIVQYIPEYNAHRFMDIDQVFNNSILDELEILNTVVQYIPEVYYVTSSITENAVLIRKIMAQLKNEGNRTRFIFTKDPFAYQLACVCPNTHIIRTKKSNNRDETYTISYFDFYKKLQMEKKLKTTIGEGISPELYSLYLAFAGCSYKGVRAIHTYPTTDRIIHDLVNRPVILNAYNASIALDPDIARTLGGNIQERYKGLDLMFQYNAFCITPYIYMQNLYDPKAINNMNDRLFTKYPLDLAVF